MHEIPEFLIETELKELFKLTLLFCTKLDAKRETTESLQLKELHLSIEVNQFKLSILKEAWNCDSKKNYRLQWNFKLVVYHKRH